MTKNDTTKSNSDAELIRMKSAVNGAMTAIMMVDRDLVINYANKATVDLLTDAADELRKVFPSFSPDTLIGTCIDDFHAKPAHQRKLLSDPANLPYSTDIQVGALTFLLNVTAQVDVDGSYIGNTLEWQNVTDMRKREAEVTALQSTVAGSMTPFMMVDRDLKITYTNKATNDLLAEVADEFRKVFPGFNPANLMGTCIDDFHANPAHQRQLLSDPANLPYSTDISVGDLTFELNVIAQIDPDGNYVGNALEWQNVTTARKRATEVTALQSTIDSSLTPFMMVDRDLKITYTNKATNDLLAEVADEFRKVFPGFNPANLMGTCIDDFHANPAHQRQLLSDPANLPYSTDISVGDLTFELNVIAQIDPDGNYVGNALEWQNVTTARKRATEVTALQSTIDSSLTPFMMVDRDLKITYTNKATNDLLAEVADEFRKVFPGFNPNNLMGTCIDDFHANPAHQRKLLDDPNNLPYSTDISVGDLKFELNVIAQIDPDGNYVGNALEWQNVTEARQKELEVARLQSAVDGAQANLMLCDEDLNITYANPAVVRMLEARETELRKIFPGLNPRALEGTNIDQFHKNPAHQRGLLGNVSQLPANADINVAGIDFQVNATAITDNDGNYMGNMVEWRDVTDQKDAERQVETLISSALEGDLNARINNAENYEGFMKAIATGINSLMDTVVEPIRESAEVVQALAEGDLTKNIDKEFNGEFGQLTDAVNGSISNLLGLVTEINEGAVSIQSSASEIAQGNLDLSNRTEQQASSLEETAASMEELTGTVRQNADNAKQANNLAVNASDQAEQGGEVVTKAISAMKEINEASTKISDIIGVIDEIAFQTNLLALNAAVEAARAGEQGRGFAVVASEVRTLAQRSAGAAKEIKSLINDSVKKVEEGSKLVDESGETLTEIVGSVKKVTDIVAEIAAASQEQSIGIDQINTAITQMDEGTQQNAALVEEAAAASKSMDVQAGQLMEQVSYFNTGSAGATRPAPAPEKRPAQARPAATASRAPRKSQQATSRATAVASSSAGEDWDEF